jgi:ferritin
MKPKVEKALNEQIHAEFYSFYLYLSVSAYFRTIHLDGFANWMNVQAHEELGHAMKLFDFLIDRGGTVALMAIAAPDHEWASPSAAFDAVLAHEKHITERIDTLFNVSMAEKDHATTVLLHWYVSEQVEEVATAETLTNQVKMVESSSQGLLMLDRELAGRQLAPPPPAP